MKKITFLLLTFLSLFITLSINSHAESSNNSDIDDEYWEIIDDYAYYKWPKGLLDSKSIVHTIESPANTKLEYAHFQNGQQISEWELIQSQSQSKLILNKSVIKFTFEGMIYNDVVHQRKFRLEFVYEDRSPEFIVIFGGGADNSIEGLDSLLDGRKFRYKIIGDGPEIPDDADYWTWDQLPQTSNNQLSNVYFDVLGTEVVVKIVDRQTIRALKYNFSSGTDMSIFNTLEAYFININNTPQIIINHSDRLYLRDILEAPEGEAPAFVPHTIWDLKTNEIVTQNTYAVNVYIKQNDAGVMISYVYIDEYIMDTILSATLSWNSRTKSTALWGLIDRGYSDWETHQATFTSSDYLKYKNLTSNWENYVPGWNQIRNIYQNIKTFEMPRISSVNLSNPQTEYNVTKNEVETYFKKVNPNFETLNVNPRFKLWAFALEPETLKQVNSWLGVGILNENTEFYNDSNNPSDPLNMQIININYQTNGKLYTALGNDMDLFIYVAPPLRQTNSESHLTKIIFLAIVFLWVYALFKNKGLTSVKKFIEVTLIFMILVILVYAAYIYLLPVLTNNIGFYLRL